MSAVPFGPELLAVWNSDKCFKQHCDELGPVWSHRPSDVWRGNSSSSWCLHLCNPSVWGAVSPCPPCLTNISLEHVFPFLTFPVSVGLCVCLQISSRQQHTILLGCVFGCWPCSSSSERAVLRPYLGHWTSRFVCHERSGAGNVSNTGLWDL